MHSLLVKWEIVDASWIQGNRLNSQEEESTRSVAIIKNYSTYHEWTSWRVASISSK